MASPNAADLPRPLAAVRATVDDRVFSEMASTKVKMALPCVVSIALGSKPEDDPYLVDRFGKLGKRSDDLYTIQTLLHIL